VSAPYERPESPDLTINTAELPLDESLRQLLALALRMAA
jgi:adenylylsulfate kinase-like enzyme